MILQAFLIHMIIGAIMIIAMSCFLMIHGYTGKIFFDMELMNLADVGSLDSANGG